MVKMFRLKKPSLFWQSLVLHHFLCLGLELYHLKNKVIEYYFDNKDEFTNVILYMKENKMQTPI